MKNQFQRHNLFLVLVSVLLLWTRVESVRFDLESGRTKCISEDVKINAMTVGKYKIINPNEGQPLPDSHKVTVHVMSAYGNNYHQADHVSEGQFAFQSPEVGEYSACFHANDHNPSITLTIEFEWKSGMATKDWTTVAKKGSVEMMEVELKKMFDVIQTVSESMYDLRNRESEMQQMNRDTNSRMFWFSFLSIGICASVAGLQFWHLKSFFEKKKLI